MIDQHLQAAVADLHAARLSLQGVLVALARARGVGEPIAGGVLRVIDAEFRGASEEVAVIGALLASIDQDRDRRVPHAVGRLPS